MAEDAYAQALASLFAARRGGIDFGLERMRACLATLALEHEPDSVVQVAGTNGKGSTCAFLAEILKQAGYRVGVFSSPHLLSICERFRVDGAPVERSDFVRAYEAVSRYEGELTFFEKITAMAAWLFDAARVDVAVYEVGLGGRLDSTTAIGSTLSVVTGIGLDHCEFLGNTLEEIALEKAGIFREGVPAVIGLSAPPEIRAQLRSLSGDGLMVGRRHVDQVPIRLGLPGAYQRDNAACAVAAVECLREQGLQIESSAIGEGLIAAQMSGRMQHLGEGLWIDGAHNAQAAAALADELATDEPLILVVGLSNTKDIAGFLEPLKPHCRQLIVTEAAGDRAYPASQLAAAAAVLGYQDVITEASPWRAVSRATEGQGKVIVTGSLLLLGEVLSALEYPGGDPIVVTDPGGARP